MRNILVPTDFSKTAEDALIFASGLAKNEDAKLILLHIYDINYTSGYVSVNILTEELAELEEQSQEKLRSLNIIIANSGQIEHESISVKGDAIDGILKTIYEKDIDLIVMGTKGASGFTGAIFGSNTAEIIEKATCPVIAVPEGGSYTGIKKITYATSYLKSDIEGLKKVVEIASPLNAQINILHISGYEESPQADMAAMEKFKETVKSNIDFNNITFQTINGPDVEKALEDYINTNSTDMLVMSTHYRNFFDKIFDKSITKHVAHHTTIPLMTLHHK